MNRQFETPSPVVFPSASPTPKLYSTPSKKLPQVEAWQDNIGIESVPQQQNVYYQQYDHQQVPQQYSYSSREKLMHQQNTINNTATATGATSIAAAAAISTTTDTATAISPLSVMMESDTLLDDEDISSYRFSEDEYLSSIISSSSSIASSRQSSPLNQRHCLRRHVSYTSSSPLQQQKIIEEQEEKPIVGIPFEPAPNVDPVHERLPTRRFSFNGSTTTTLTSSENNVKMATSSTNKLGSLISRFKKVAISGKSTSLFK